MTRHVRRPLLAGLAVALLAAIFALFRGGLLVLDAPLDLIVLALLAALSGAACGLFLCSLDSDPLPLWLGMLLVGGAVFAFAAQGQASGDAAWLAAPLAYASGLALCGFPAGFRV